MKRRVARVARNRGAREASLQDKGDILLIRRKVERPLSPAPFRPPSPFARSILPTAERRRERIAFATMGRMQFRLRTLLVALAVAVPVYWSGRARHLAVWWRRFSLSFSEPSRSLQAG